MSVRIWKSLGIAPTRDKKAIKSAFQARKTQAGTNLREVWLLEEDYRQALRMAEDSGYLIQSSATAYKADPKVGPIQPGTPPEIFPEEEQKAKGSGCSSVLGIVFFLVIIGFKVGFIPDMISSFFGKDDKVLIEESQRSKFQQAILDCDTVTASQGLAAGEDPNQSVEEIPAFCLAIAICQEEMFMLLLNSGADPNRLDKDDSNSLHYAVAIESKDMVEFLLDLKVNPNQRNKVGQTPLDLAREGNLSEIVTILSKHTEQAAQPEPEH